MLTSNCIYLAHASTACWHLLAGHAVCPVAENDADMSEKAEEDTDAIQDEGMVQGDRWVRMDYVESCWTRNDKK